MEQTRKTRSAIFDYTKLVLSALIVILHTGAGLPILFVQSVCRVAVPTFFAISGLFLLEHLESDAKMFKSVKKVLVLYLVYTLLYTPLALKMGAWTLNFSSIRTALMYGTFIHLWYFPALFFSLLILWALRKIFSRSFFLIAGVASTILYMWGVGAFTWQVIPDIVQIFPLFSSVFNSTPINFVYMGLFFVWLGMLVQKTKSFWENHTKLAGMLLLVSGVAYIVECNYVLRVLGTSTTITVSLVPVTYLLMCCLSQCEFSAANSVSIRNISTVIYGVQYIVYFNALPFFTGWFEQNGGRWAQFLFFLFVFGVSAFIGVIVNYCARYIKILKLLY